ncbi:hypothetical protein ACIQTW_07635, partial [Paenarthrobacter sp. NPDC090517]|uniref:hypothetical protein n=1 Tax=Paenarthrobacter sp. NPDC090517 TaxID=3364381 RepID=UPI0037FD89E9
MPVTAEITRASQFGHHIPALTHENPRQPPSRTVPRVHPQGPSTVAGQNIRMPVTAEITRASQFGHHIPALTHENP